MSDSDNDNYQMYGTLLEPYDEDNVPKKKAFSIEDQIATDEQGRRRFHGAFTGGFSAGFFNTVGSLEGWKPTEFKSSRSEKAEKKSQTVQDFMDTEDIGEFGIAPSLVKTKEDYSNKKTRKRNLKTDGPIPGVPVLQLLLEPARETVGIRLLKKMGWKPGQGIGPRVTKSQKKKTVKENQLSTSKIYGCNIPEEYRKKVIPSDNDSTSSDDEFEITFAPSDYDPYIYKPKDNTFGMGYSGLDKNSILSTHINLFDPPTFSMRDHKNNKISISGQAFGVGAFENEDEDIYTKDDMSKYDFELGSASYKNKKKTPKKVDNKIGGKILEGFVLGKNPFSIKKIFPPPVLPKNFIPKHENTKNILESQQIVPKEVPNNKVGRHDLTASERSKLINLKPPTSTFNSDEQSTEKLKENALKITNSLPKSTPTPLGAFKPFISNPDKQKRYEEYLTLKKLKQEKQLTDIQPASMAEWEKEREKYEFEQAARMFRPKTGLIFDKFVAASSSDDNTDPLKPVGRSIYQHGTQDMRDAAKKKMFGNLTRDIEIWKPNKLVCRRFNVPEPDISETEMALSKRRKNKFSVFDYYEAYQQNKTIKEGPDLKPESNIDSITKQSEMDIINKAKCEINLNIKNCNSEELIKRNEDISKTKENTDKSISNFSSKSSKAIFLEEDQHQLPSTSSSINIFKTIENVGTIKKLPETKTINPLPEITKLNPLPSDPKERKDLFKAIFLSSSESEDEKDDPKLQQEEKIIEMKKIVLENDRNTEKNEKSIINPPTKSKGLFSDLDWNKINKPKPNNPPFTSLQETSTRETKKLEETYGPKLPSEVKINPEPSVWKPTFNKVYNKTIVKVSSSSSEDEWMEADSSTEKSSKKSSKKSKKHKSKHKKHKSKHKKKKH